MHHWLLTWKNMDTAHLHNFKKQIFGVNKEVVLRISKEKNEPQWMTDFRLRALEIFDKKHMPTWGADLSGLNHEEIQFYIKPVDTQQSSWDTVPENIKKTFEALGVPQAERSFLAGVGAQFESEIVYQNLQKKWKESLLERKQT